MIPKHIGFIMDGNGRWAESHGFERAQGYLEGFKALIKVVDRCAELGVKAISVYAFSSENWKRASSEIEQIQKVVMDFNNHNDGEIKITYMGDESYLSEEFLTSINTAKNSAIKKSKIILNIAFNYSGRNDILASAKKCSKIGDFDQKTFESFLGSSHLPELDIIVRTGGQKRLSGFMLYECAYAELVFLDKFWPDIEENDVDDIIQEFNNRKRTFGGY